MTQSRRYTLSILAFAGSIVGSIVAVNLLVDPYNYFGWNTLGVYISAERESKAKLIRREDYDALLVGDSKPGMIPVSKLQGYRFFNASFGGATTTEMAQFIDRFAHGESLVLIGLDACKDDPTGPQGDPFVPWRLADVVDKTLSTQTLEYSIRTIKDHFIGTPPHMSSDGSFIADKWFELYDVEDPDRMRGRLEETSRHYENYTYPGPQRMASLRRIRSILEARGIPCVVFIPPLHEEVARRLQASPGQEAFQQWKAEVESLFPVVLDFSNSRWSAATNFFLLDPVHFKPQVGADLINQEILPRLKPRPAPPDAKATASPERAPSTPEA